MWSVRGKAHCWAGLDSIRAWLCLGVKPGLWVSSACSSRHSYCFPNAQLEFQICLHIIPPLMPVVHGLIPCPLQPLP